MLAVVIPRKKLSPKRRPLGVPQSQNLSGIRRRLSCVSFTFPVKSSCGRHLVAIKRAGMTREAPTCAIGFWFCANSSPIMRRKFGTTPSPRSGTVLASVNDHGGHDGSGSYMLGPGGVPARRPIGSKVLWRGTPRRGSAPRHSSSLLSAIFSELASPRVGFTCVGASLRGGKPCPARRSRHAA
jgi:hypothetical protein